MIIEFPPAKDAAQPSTAQSAAPPLSEAARTATTTKADITFERETSFENPFVKCQHAKMQINESQRTVKCGDCGIWLDPVWCLRYVFWFYDQRVDNRLAALKEHETREKERRAKEDERRKQPRARRRRQRDEALDRAAYNEYQARVLALRAERQRATAAKIDDELGETLTADVEAAAARERMKAGTL